MRGRHVRESMSAETFKTVTAYLTSNTEDCNPSIFLRRDTCNLLQKGLITIRGVTSEISLDNTVDRSDNGYQLKGTIVFPLTSFGVEDPSNLFAKLKPDVAIKYVVAISA